MVNRIKSTFLMAVFLIAGFTQLAYAGRSPFHDGYLVVPRIDVNGYGALRLVFQLQVGDEYLFILEQYNEASLSVPNSGVFDPVQLTIDIDEISLWTGELYSAQLRLETLSPQIAFSISNVVHLNPQLPLSNPADDGDTGNGDGSTDDDVDTGDHPTAGGDSVPISNTPQTGIVEGLAQDDGYITISGIEYGFNEQLTIVVLAGQAVDSAILDQGLELSFFLNAEGTLLMVEITGPSDRLDELGQL